MRDRRASITPPNLAIALSILAGIAFYRVGEGLLTSTVSFEMWGASLPAALIGATGSAFFAGCLIGTLICVRLIERVGVVRTFSVIVLILVGTVLLLILIKHPLSWLMTRLVMGVGAAGFLVIVEAWLDGQTPLARRGKVLSLNFLLYYAAYALGQMVFGVLDSNGVALGSERAAFRGEPLGTGGVLILSSGLLLAVAALPILLSPSSSPILKEPPTLPFRRLMSISPLGVMGCFGSGLLVAALYVLAPVYGAELGMSRLEIGSLVAAMVIGALALHWPLARLSCAFGRRLVLIGALLGAVIGSVAMIGLSAQAAYLSMLAGLLTGGFVFSIFPLALSHACDWVHVRERQAVMGGLIPVWGIGAIIGPSLGAIAIERAGPPGLFMCVAVVCVLLVCFGFFRVTMRSSDKGVHRMTFALIPQHGLFFSAAMHRPDIDHQHSFDFDGGNTGGVDARGNQIRTKPGESE